MGLGKNAHCVFVRLVICQLACLETPLNVICVAIFFVGPHSRPQADRNNGETSQSDTSSGGGQTLLDVSLLKLHLQETGGAHNGMQFISSSVDSERHNL